MFGAKKRQNIKESQQNNDAKKKWQLEIEEENAEIPEDLEIPKDLSDDDQIENNLNQNTQV